jgi:glycosyltransferase involved in cell wall biosynthesis
MRIRQRMARTSRVVVVTYNPYLALLYRLATWLGIRGRDSTMTFVTLTDMRNLARLSGLEIVRVRPCVAFPWRMLGIGTAINAFLSMLPFFGWRALVHVITLRPIVGEGERPSLSIVIPARNERGNIEEALRRMPDLRTRMEIIFVEGHSNDGTWEEIERVAAAWRDRFDIKALRQTGKGKNDAVRLGFSHATGELLTILDADLSMPPELLVQFYEAWVRGLADFINGSRLVYPMEGNAMRFLNRLGNVFFAKALSHVLDTAIGDSLCGTKLFARHDYARMAAWRRDFGEFDPFGDFELLFPAAILSLGVIDVPVRYRARAYGSTNINRFRDGSVLLQMTLLGFLRVKSAARSRRRSRDDRSQLPGS